MSKIGEAPVQVKDNVQVSIDGEIVTVKGPQGELTVTIPQGIDVKLEDGTVHVTRQRDTKKVRALHGLVRSLIANAVKGVVEPWEKHLEVVGTGYKVKAQGKNLVFDVGYSHSVQFDEVPGLTYKIDKNQVTVVGADKQLVGETAHKIRSIRKPDAYKGKGVRYVGEVLHLKPGKKAKTA